MPNDQIIQAATKAPALERKPAIYSILEFRRNGEGQRVALHHLVAAFTSEEAEAAYIDAIDWEHRIDAASEFYIATDEFRQHDRTPHVLQYVSGTDKHPEKGVEIVTDADHNRWIEVMTKPSWDDGELQQPLRRRFFLRRPGQRNVNG